jgi:hypothetical protein
LATRSPGCSDSRNGITDALRRQGKIEWIHVSHEEAAAFAAGAEAYLTGSLAAAVPSPSLCARRMAIGALQRPELPMSGASLNNRE